MKNPFEIGSIQKYIINITEKDTATFHDENVHPVYATFALTRDAEWTCRQFVLAMKEPHEEGIGTFGEVNHVAPALVNETVTFSASLQKVEANEILCNFEAKVEERLIATGKTGQKIISKEKLAKLFEAIRK
jgi:predicted thioesterase